MLTWFYSDHASFAAARREWATFVATKDSEWTAFLVAVLEGMSNRPEQYEESVSESSFLVHEFATLVGALPADQLDALARAMRSAVGRWPMDGPTRAPVARGILDDVLVAWVPAIPPARAQELLRGGGLSRRETLELLSSLRHEGLPGGDLSIALASLAADNSDAFWAGVSCAPYAIPEDAVAATDRIVLQDSQTSPYTDYAKGRLAPYLRRTERAGWPAARLFVEEGLAAGGRAPERFASVLVHLDPKPNGEYVRWVLSRFEVPTVVADDLRSAFHLE